MKLKTLKDLMVYGSGFTFVGTKSKSFPYPMFREVDLKQEAIKDIQYLRQLPEGEGSLDKIHKKDLDEKYFALFDAMAAYDNSNVIAYIKWKFNITEEDLK